MDLEGLPVHRQEETVHGEMLGIAKGLVEEPRWAACLDTPDLYAEIPKEDIPSRRSIVRDAFRELRDFNFVEAIFATWMLLSLRKAFAKPFTDEDRALVLTERRAWIADRAVHTWVELMRILATNRRYGAGSSVVMELDGRFTTPLPDRLERLWEDIACQQGMSGEDFQTFVSEVVTRTRERFSAELVADGLEMPFNAGLLKREGDNLVFHPRTALCNSVR